MLIQNIQRNKQGFPIDIKVVEELFNLDGELRKKKAALEELENNEKQETSISSRKKHVLTLFD